MIGIVNSKGLWECSPMHMCRKANRQGSIGLVDDLPLDAADTTHGWVGQLVEGVGREVEIIHCTSGTPVGQDDSDGDALV